MSACRLDYPENNTEDFDMYAKPAITIAFLSCVVGCSEMRPPPVEEPQYQQQVHTQRLICEDMGTFWRYSNNPHQWYIELPDGTWQAIQGYPPCAQPPPPPPSSAPNDLQGLGLEPDGNGKISPWLAVAKYEAQSRGQYNENDRLDLYIAGYSEWRMPYHVDESLHNAIGPLNINFFPVDVGVPTQHTPGIIALTNVRLGDAIKVLSSLGVSEISATSSSGKPLKAELNADINTYTAAKVYIDNELVDTVPLR